MTKKELQALKTFLEAIDPAQRESLLRSFDKKPDDLAFLDDTFTDPFFDFTADEIQIP